MLPPIHSASTALLAISLSSVASYELLPARTNSQAAIEYLGWTPKPTTAPLLEPRQSPDYICGYVDGNTTQGNAITCETMCGFNYQSSMFGCCASTFTSANSIWLSDCAYYSACSASTDICDSSCRVDTSVAKCTDPDHPFCVKYTLFAGTNSFSNFGCNSNATDVVTVYSNAEASTTTTSARVSEVGLTSTSSSLITSAASSSSTTSAASLVPFSESQASASGGVPTVTVTTNAASRGLKMAWLFNTLILLVIFDRC